MTKANMVPNSLDTMLSLNSYFDFLKHYSFRVLFERPHLGLPQKINAYNQRGRLPR